ncbi:MAG: Rieske 2Fe-2S domain-containing protein, partial [Candidatus Entotheonellia bacterium]
MATRAPFLTQPYGAYYHRDVPDEDEELTHVGPGTPCGEYLRRFWQPVALSKNVQERPLRVRILGEDLVVFRDKSGQVGCLELHCPHRGTSLEFGLIAEKGIRCCYHAWQIDVDGRILDTPGEPADSMLKDRLCHGAYPIHEYQGMVFAYMGPPDKRPAFPILDTYHQPGCRMVPLIQHFYPCNWLQIQENVMDPAHLEFLHTITGSHFPDELRMHSVLDWMES